MIRRTKELITGWQGWKIELFGKTIFEVRNGAIILYRKKENSGLFGTRTWEYKKGEIYSHVWGKDKTTYFTLKRKSSYYKYWRTDLNVWEEKFALGFITLYRRSINENGELIKWWSLSKKGKARYMISPYKFAEF